MANRDPYEVLGVAKDASPSEIKSAYHRLARQHHPDVNNGDREAEERFKEVNEAYQILVDPQRRERYDRFGTADEVPSGGDFFQGGGFGDLFDMFFGGATQSAGRRRSRGRDGEDVRAEIRLELRDVLEATRHKVRYRRAARCQECGGTGSQGGEAPIPCATCQGSGQVSRVQQTFLGAMRTSATCPTCGGAGETVKHRCGTCAGRAVQIVDDEAEFTAPAGVEDGMSLRVPGKGSDGVGGGRNGDLYVSLHVAHDERFEREGTTLHTELTATYAQAVLGDRVSIPGVAGDVDVLIPPGTQPGDVLRVRGEGLPPLHGGSRGDLLAHIVLEVPRKVSEGQRKLLREFAELGGERVPEEPNASIFGGIFGKKKK